MKLNQCVARVGLSLVVIGLPLAGCGKAKETVVEKAIEAAASKDGAKVDIEKGKMTITTKDGESTLTSNEQGNALTMKTPEGTVTVSSGENAKVPDDFPKDIPLYPGAKPATVTSSSEKMEFMLTFTTKDPVEKVGEHFKKEVTAQGWTEGMVMNTPGEQATQMLNYTKGGRSLMVVISKQSDDTTIQVTTSGK
ncbi:MAG: hypothetical protein HZB26_11390 [Candidatus Hydrogenedentes bacterium]|nr:hypothetical protein [Candidatus Hydrogenedentota bacterium]